MSTNTNSNYEQIENKNAHFKKILRRNQYALGTSFSTGNVLYSNKRDEKENLKSILKRKNLATPSTSRNAENRKVRYANSESLAQRIKNDIQYEIPRKITKKSKSTQEKKKLRKKYMNLESMMKD